MRISPNNERYIGQTVHSELHRWKRHVYDSKNKNSNGYNTPLSQAIRKYGADAFDVVILESGITSDEELNQREEYWIKEYHTLHTERRGGLNATIGGLGHRQYTEENFRELYDSGYSIGEISKITGAANSTISDHLHASKHENYRRGRAVSMKKDPPRRVSCYDIKTCELIASYESTTDAAIKIGKSPCVYGVIGRAANGESHSAYGYLWKYDDEPIDVIYKRQAKYNNSKGYSTKRKAVVNIETNELFKSTNAAGKAYQIDGRQISACCIGKRSTAGGFHWRFEGQPLIEHTAKADKRCKPVICKETNVVYSGVKEASVQSGIYINMLRDCLKHRTDSAGGYHWEYYNI